MNSIHDQWTAFWEGWTSNAPAINPVVTTQVTYTIQPVAPKEKAVPKVKKNNPKYLKPVENPWGLMGHTLALYKWAADYYILTVMTMQEPKNKAYNLMLEKRSEKIADQFARYTDMAVGGEIRHTPKSNYKTMNRPMIEALEDGTIGHSQSGTGRHSAWNGWYWFRQRYGTVALKWAVEIFKTMKWSSAYGGLRWGDIANTLYLYESEDISKHVFIDTCWGLQHNGGVYFNKWWTYKLSTLKKVLDLNLQGHYCIIADQYASQMVKKMFAEKVKESCLCSKH